MVRNQLVIGDDLENDRELIVYINGQDRIYLQCGSVEDEMGMYCGYITLSKFDALALSDKLKEFAKELSSDYE